MTDQARQIETQLVYWNDEYRKGTPVVSDPVFDSLLEQFESFVTVEEYTRVRESLFNTKGDVKHQYIIGSLKKTKAEDDSILKWIGKDNVTEAYIVEKLDGMSIVLHYVDSVLVKAVSRGDGEYGKDYTENLKHIAPLRLDLKFTGQVRAEVVLPISELKNINDIGFTYKNPRNATTGLITSKSTEADLLKRCKVIAYQIMGSTEKKPTQYSALYDLGFTLPKRETFDTRIDNVTPNSLKAIYEIWTAQSDYEIDGLVIHNLNYGDENIKLPTHTIAFKVNDLVATTTVLDIEWEMSRGKEYRPVVVFKAIELGGATIQRATGNNLQWLIDHKLEIGCSVIIEKAGDIIPRIVQVV